MESLFHSSSPLTFFAAKPFASAKSTTIFSSSSWRLSKASKKLDYRRSAIVCASKKKKNRKEDFHSFVPKQDEGTGPFPEAVLLKQRQVEKDGRLFPEFDDEDEEKVYQILKLQLENDLEDERRLRHYEVVYLIHEKNADEVEIVNKKIEDFLGEKRATIWRTSDWGMRRLAYKIQKARNAHYFLMNFEMEAKWISDFKTMLDKDERVIRHLTMKRDEAVTEDCPPPPEFRTFHAGMDDEEEEEDDMEYTDEDYDEEDEIDDGDGIIIVDDEEDDRTQNMNGKTRTSKSMADKVGR